MPIRRAQFSDHAAMASVCGAAFFNEDLFGRVMHPYRNDYPDDVQLYWHAYIRNHWVDWRNQIFVVTTEDEKIDGKKREKIEKIVGVAIWQRQGAGGKRLELSVVDPRNLTIPLTRLSNRINNILYPNRASDPTKSDIFLRGIPYSKHHWSGAREENWYLDLLCVHPDAQGKGLGRELVSWGIRKADEEGVHASVMSSDGNEEFYFKCGFEETVGWATEGEGNPLRGVKGGAIMFRYPKTGNEIVKAEAEA